MQRHSEVEGSSGAGLMAYEGSSEARPHGVARCHCVSQLCKTDRLITKRCQDFLMAQQTLGIGFEHQHRFTNAAADDAGRMSNRRQLIRWRTWKPDVETRSRADCAFHADRSTVLMDNLQCGSESQTIALEDRKST